ncbi:melanophilin a isoform X5 [Gouania willdenowi]|uniref:melanophilin a isoform X5 n=1 Tax=Gouania willdenowi TaxID=441366 RepID=UPI001056DCE2|nr:melanophilin-like isoform X5 [Gouania willdenowi]
MLSHALFITAPTDDARQRHQVIAYFRGMERKLDLSRLSDQEAKHVWEVIQRDFNLRKKEEERLGELKTKIEKEDTKMELFGDQTQVSDSLCIRCLQPFKFLLNSKRQCLDCQLFVCKSCSRYNKKEHGWVCDNCRMTRVLKIGTLGWYHDNVRNRFKRFGSAKVMRSLYKRLNGDNGRDDDTQSMPDVRSHVYNNLEDDYDEADVQCYRKMRKNKRLLSVHPMDFDTEDYQTHSRRQSVQHDDRFYRNEMDYDVYNQRGNRRKSMDRYGTRMEEAGPMDRTRSLSKISSSVARQQYVDTSDEEDFQRFPTNQMLRRKSRASSQENLRQAPPVNQLSKRMSAIESLLCRLEEKMTTAEQVYIATGQSFDLESKLQRLERSAKNNFGGTTDSDLSELEDVVALTAARVQSAESEVSDIETKLLALNTSGSKKKVSGNNQRKRSTVDFPKTNGAQW